VTFPAVVLWMPGAGRDHGAAGQAQRPVCTAMSLERGSAVESEIMPLSVPEKVQESALLPPLQSLQPSRFPCTRQKSLLLL